MPSGIPGEMLLLGLLLGLALLNLNVYFAYLVGFIADRLIGYS